jgi:hypothetical protein
LAEGLRKTKDSIGVSNAEPYLILKSLGIFEKYFWIKTDNWKVFIKTDEREKSKLRKILNKWDNNLGLVTRSSYSSLAKNQAVDVRLNSRILNKFLKDYIKKSLALISKDRTLSEYFLRGYFVGDGCPIKRKDQIHSITITTKEETHLKFLVEIMNFFFGKMPNVRLTKKSYEIYYCAVGIITEAILAKIFIDSERQWNKFVNGYKNKQYTRARIKYWKEIAFHSLTSYEIAKLSGNSHWSVSDALNKDIKLGLVDSSCKQIHKFGAPAKSYSLSLKGLKLLNLLEGVDSYEKI